MSHILVRRAISERPTYLGDKWWYEYRSLPSKCKDDSVKVYCQRLSSQFARITKQWTEELNSEWISRIYFALKMVLSSSTMAMSLEYARKSNVRIVESYLEYYMVLNSLRAIMLTMPSQAWADGALIETTHSKTRNVSLAAVSQLDKNVALQLDSSVKYLKAFRELISYRGPSSGGAYNKPPFDVIEWCRFLLEIAQLQSELLERSIHKNSVEGYSLKAEFIEAICRSEIDGVEFHDTEDAYRMGYLRRKHPLPTNIMHMMSEGHVEDYFGSWCAETSDPSMFDPDDNWRILFDVP